MKRLPEFRIWKNRQTGEWYLAAPGNIVASCPSHRAAVAIMDIWHDDRR